jgi:hypothetical protein
MKMLYVTASTLNSLARSMYVILLFGTASQPGGAFFSTPFTGAVTWTSGGGGRGALRWRLGLGVAGEGGGLGGLGGAALRV